MMEDDSKSIASTSTEFSTGSSVGSNTPSLVGENLESFCLGETEKGAPEGKTTYYRIEHSQNFIRVNFPGISIFTS